MLSICDREFINYIKNSDRITIDLINYIRDAYFLKSRHTHLKLKLLDMRPHTFATIQKIDEAHENLEFYLTILGYWTLKKIKDELPSFDYYLPEEEPVTINYNIIKKMERTILFGKTNVMDVLSIENDIAIIKKSGRVVNPSGKIGLKNIAGLCLSENDCFLINQIFDERNERQRIKYELGSRPKYTNSNRVKVYYSWNDFDVRCDNVPNIWIVNPQKTLCLYKISEEGTFKENKNFDSIVNNEQKIKNKNLRLNRKR